MPIPIEASSRAKTKPEAPKELSSSPQPSDRQVEENNNHSGKTVAKVVAKTEDRSDKRRSSMPAKRKSSGPNLLGQLNVDKKYLQDLLKCPGINKPLVSYHFNCLSPSTFRLIK